MVFGGSDIRLENLENLCKKTFRFIKKKHGKTGPHIDICSNMHQNTVK